MTDKVQLIPAVNKEIIEASGATELLQKIRPQWQARDLIKRVARLLPVDPSSACQRIFNASIHDLKEKIITAGLDIAAEAARQYKLPTVARPEDIENYSVSHTITLAYRMGLLSHPEWRRLLRVYDIRRDLEHEDDQYEASIEDCFYIFKTCIEVVLSRDPVQLFKLTDVKEIVEQPNPAMLSETLLEDYRSAPSPRQLEIYRFLISTSLNNKHPDIVRQNSYNILGTIAGVTNRQVVIESANEFMARLERRPPTLDEARVAFAAGILPYLKKSVLNDFFKSFFDMMKKVGFSFKNHNKHGELLRNLAEVGGVTHCPDEVLPELIEWLILCYIGESSYGPWSAYRKVFYSNTGAPLALDILRSSEKDISSLVKALGERSKEIKQACSDEYVARRYQEISGLRPEIEKTSGGCASASGSGVKVDNWHRGRIQEQVFEVRILRNYIKFYWQNLVEKVNAKKIDLTLLQTCKKNETERNERVLFLIRTAVPISVFWEALGKQCSYRDPSCRLYGPEFLLTGMLYYYKNKPGKLLGDLMATLSEAPLIESIIEIRWGEHKIEPNKPVEFKFSAEDTDFFPGQFHSIANSYGFVFVERINKDVPPFIPHVVRYRFRRTEGTWPCYQIGLGIFTVNQVNEGYNWGTFKKDILTGLEMLERGTQSD